MHDTHLYIFLAGAFATAAIPHLLLLAHRTGRGEYLWFGLGCLAAAGAAAACGVTADTSNATLVAAQRAAVAFCAVWLVAMTWFTVEYAGGGGGARRVAMLLTLLFAAALIGQQFLMAARTPADTVPMSHAVHLVGILAMTGLLALVAHSAFRLWHDNQKFRSMALCIGLGAALVTFSATYAVADHVTSGAPDLVPVGFVPLVFWVWFELVRERMKLREAAILRGIGDAHVSRLALVGELTASMAHEINQPLGAILSNTEAGDVMLERGESTEEVRHILQDIRRDALRASGVIKSVRTLVRNTRFSSQKLDANRVATEVCALLESAAHERAIGIDFRPAQEPAWIRGDQARLEQVLLNLMLNAMDATEALGPTEGLFAEPRPVRLEVARTLHGEVEIRVVDQGIGIPADRLDHLFESFYTSKAHGMGLGLSIARSLVEAHGGRIGATNNAERGATLCVTLPPFV